MCIRDRRNVYTVSMSLDAGSSFDMTVGSASPGIKIVYAGGPSAQSNNWLTCTKNASTGLASGSSYTFKVTDGYSKLFPRATVRVYDVLSGTENILYVDAVSVPQPLTTTQPAKAPNGTSDNPNSFDAANATVTLYRITGSSVDVSFLCPDEMVLVGKPGWMDVSEPVKNGTKYTYTLTLNDRDVELTTTTAAGTRASVAETTDNTVVFANSKNTSTLKVPITIKLKDAPMTLNFAALGGSNNSYAEPSGDTPGKITMSVANGNTCLVPAVSMDGVEVMFDFGGNPEWLTSTVTTTDTSVGSKQQNVKFQLVSDKLAGAKDVTVTLKNKIGGADRKFTISPNVGSLSFSGNSSWGVDVLNTGGKTMTLYKVASGNSEKMKITVNSWGGSKVESSNTSIVTVSGLTEQSVDAAVYQLVATGFGTATLTFTNRVDPTKNVTYNVTVNSFSAPTLNSSSVTLKSVPRNQGSSNLSATVTVTSPVGGYEVSVANSSIVKYSMSGNNCTVEAIKAGNTSLTFRNKLDNTKTATYNVAVTGVLYEGMAVWEYYGFYIAPVNAGSFVQWDNKVSSNYYCKSKSGGTWYTPSAAEWRTIIQTTGDENMSQDLHDKYMNTVFKNEYYWSIDGCDSNTAYIMEMRVGNASVRAREKDYKGTVRCIAKK